jgi:hypothetical protein
MKTGEEI